MNIILIDEETCNRIQTLQLEVESRKEIISQVLSNMVRINGSLFKSYQDEYHQIFVQYNLAKDEMLKKYDIPDKANWKLDFNTRELTYDA
jgi:hypothetical protein